MSDAGVLAEVRIVGAAASDKSDRYFLEEFLRAEKHVVASAGEAVTLVDDDWLSWFADRALKAQKSADELVRFLIEKTRLMDRYVEDLAAQVATLASSRNQA